MYKAVIFDLDGTLLDSLNDIVAVLNDALKHFGLPPISRGQAQTYIGNGAKELVRLAIGEKNCNRLSEILAYYKDKYSQSDNNYARLYEGEEEALTLLKNAGVKIAVLTNKPHEAALKAEKIFFAKYGFDCVTGQIDGAPLKPDPQTLNEIIKRLGVSRCDCLFVGDGEADVITAKNAGIDCVSVLWGYRTKKQLELSGAEIFAENFTQLTNMILK